MFSIDKGKEGLSVEDRKGRVLKMKESPYVSFDLVKFLPIRDLEKARLKGALQDHDVLDQLEELCV